MTLRQRMEEHIVFTVFSLLLSGFLAGLGTYEGILKIAGRVTVPEERLSTLEQPVDPQHEVWTIKGTYRFEGERGNSDWINVYSKPPVHQFWPSGSFRIKLFSIPDQGGPYLPEIIIEHDGYEQFTIPQRPLPETSNRVIEYPASVILRQLPEDVSEDSYAPKDEPLPAIN